MCAVFLDFRKGFDSVPHGPLIQKLHHIGLDNHLTLWVSNYLTSRSQQVVVDGATLDPLPVISGVPQGSVLGPLLFVIYINDITTVTLTTASQCVLYADDVVLYQPISCPADFANIQIDIDEIQCWSNENLLTLNSAKCKYMLISRRRLPTLPSLAVSDPGWYSA